ncbi:37S ribosomal protein S7, mitochondrial [Zancudomyces culisetae]|uniref:37S ribosomal protein S7, mitochondrial n=1 Tax=Zancudomyces culisetae TaxID=1213189 RepID=A0A1R1PUA3_ZANCU|nr:37S ribosomal protein S7, mitochondrial [Zancudomyces culisetae]|eukprot:OMH84550.1 37S ribosomal protein S7, mitochondrial [Zancudomyces culisetae]
MLKTFRVFSRNIAPAVLKPRVFAQNYVTKFDQAKIKEAQSEIEVDQGTIGITTIVPLEKRVLLREDPLLSQIVNTIMRDGKKLRAQRQVSDALLQIKKETNSDPYRVLFDAVEMASPLMATASSKKGTKNILIPKPLNLRQRRRFAILWILEEAKKRKVRKLHLRLSAEVLAIVNGTSNVLQRKLSLHKTVLANRAQLLTMMGPGGRR